MKHRTTCRSDGACLWHNGLSINISLLTELFTVFFQKTKLLLNKYKRDDQERIKNKKFSHNLRIVK